MAVKVNRSEIPLLVVGLGGTGKDITLAIKRKFQERFNGLDPNTKIPPRTAYLVLDDDKSGIGIEPEGLVLADFHRLHVDSIGSIFTAQTFTGYEREWINPGLSTIAATDGAGGVRQLGRFQLFRNIDEVVRKTREKLDAILAHNPTTPPSAASMNVLICGSLSGGTGSGTALDMAYVVHQIIQTEHSAYASGMKMYGIFVMPENILKKTEFDENRKEELQANAYAAMKEIDYWMRQPQHRQTMTVEYSGAFRAEWNHRPFSYLGYIGNTWENGVAITNPYTEAVKKVSELILLLSAETPKAENGELIAHNIYSNLSNADNQMATLQGVAPYPVSISAMSLGMSEYSSDEVGVADYEKEKTLELVMEVPTFNPDTNQPMSQEDAELTGVELVDGILSLEKPQDEFFDSIKLGTRNVDEYIGDGRRPTLEYSKAQLIAVGQSYSQQVQSHYIQILPSTRTYFKDYFNALWANFVTEAKAYIRNIQCGPVGFLEFLDNVYLRELESSYSNSSEIVTNAGAIIQEAAEFCDAAYTEALTFHFGMPGTAQSYMNNYQARTEELCDACWENCVHRAKMEYLKEYRIKIQAYRDNLETLIEALKIKMRECAKKEVKAELVGGDLSFAQLKAYLDGSIADPEMVHQRDMSIAKARDAVLERVADDSFRLPIERKADSHTKQEELKIQFLEMVNQFVEHAFEDIGLGNLDIVLEAASQIMGEDKIKYMANTVAPRMANAAIPTLQLKTSYRNTVKSYCNFHHTSVPRDAVAIQQGLEIYNNGGVAAANQKADYTASDMTDRMMHLHMKLGIPMYMMSDVYKLRENYERVLARTNSDPCLGIHLVNKVRSFNGLRAGRAYAMKDTWLKLPSPIPPVEIERDQMSVAEKGTVDYLEELLQKAVESGIVTYGVNGAGEPFDGYMLNADLGNELLQINGLKINQDKDAVSNLHPEDIKAIIDGVFDNENATDEERLAALQEMRINNVQKDFLYGGFVQNYASALNMMPVMPIGGESPAERDRIARNYTVVRHKLCAWMLSMYPECLSLVEKNLDAFAYLHEKEQILLDRIHGKNHLYELAEQFALPLVAGQYGMDVTTFRAINRDGRPLDLFDNNLDVFNQKELKYWEAAMLMQLEEHRSGFNPSVRQLIQEILDKYPVNFRKLRDTGALEELKDKLRTHRDHWQEKLVEIRSDMKMDIQRRDTIAKIYERMIKVTDQILDSYDMWQQSRTPEATSVPAPAPVNVPAPSAPAAKPEETAPSSSAPVQAGDSEQIVFPAAYVQNVAALPKPQLVALLKALPMDRRLALVGQLPQEQMNAVMGEIF